MQYVDFEGLHGALVTDLSEAGLGVISAVPMQPQQRVRCRIDLGGSAVEAQALIVSADPTGRAGLQFVSISHADRERLKEWLLENALARGVAVVQGADNAPDSAEQFLSAFEQMIAPSLPGDAEPAAAQPAASAATSDRATLTLATLPPATDAALNVIANHARERTAADGAAIALATSGILRCRARAGEIAPPVGAPLDSGASFSGQCIRSATTLVCDDSSSDRRVDAEVCRELNIRAIVASPVRQRGRVIGVIETFSSTPQAFTAQHVQELESMAELLAAISERESPPAVPRPAPVPQERRAAPSATPAAAPAQAKAAVAAAATAPPIPAPPAAPVQPVRVAAVEKPAAASVTSAAAAAPAPAKIQPAAPIQAAPAKAVPPPAPVAAPSTKSIQEVPAVAATRIEPAAGVETLPAPAPSKSARKSAPAAAAAPAVARPVAPAPPQAAPPASMFGVPLDEAAEAPKRKSSSLGLRAAVAVLVLAVGGAGTYFGMRGSRAQNTVQAAPSTTTPVAAAQPASAPTTTAASTIPTTGSVKPTASSGGPAPAASSPAAPKTSTADAKPAATAARPERPTAPATQPVELRSPQAAPTSRADVADVAPPMVIAGKESLPAVSFSAARPVGAPSIAAGRISGGVKQGKLIVRVDARYPEQAKRLNLSGKVQLALEIGEDGKVHSAKVVSGNPVLAAAAVQAVTAWRYEPTLLDGKPVSTTADVTFDFKVPR